MDLLFYRPDVEDSLTQEIKTFDPKAVVQPIQPGWAQVEARWPDQHLSLGFVQQVWPEATSIQGESIRQWAEKIVAFVQAHPNKDAPWSLRGYADPLAKNRISTKRVQFIHEACEQILKKQQRRLWRCLQTPSPHLSEAPSLAIEFVLTTRTQGYISALTPALQQLWQHVLSPFPGGQIELGEDKAPPARAYRKLREALLYLGIEPHQGQTWVDLGACPGSWSYDAIGAGAKVWAIDRSPLREDLMQHPNLRFVQHDAFTFAPDVPVDILVCDVIAYPERSVALLQMWLEKRWCRYFVITLKFKGTPDMQAIQACKQILRDNAQRYWMRQLCNNKNEITVCGVRRG